MENVISKDYKTWLAGIEDEIKFWDNYMNSRGGVYFYSFFDDISPVKKFTLEEDIPQEQFGKEYKFIDVGSGPFSRCGKMTDLVKLNALAVDPLASVYNFLKQKYHIDNQINLETGFLELLSYKFKENSFDMVHMSNSLDHSVDPVLGICQLLYICKLGGKVILRHAENEAERECYQGLHQWNLSLKNKEESFIIWRGEQRYNICELLSDYVDFKLLQDQKEGGWNYNKVIMLKKKNIPIPENLLYKNMLEITYEKLMEMQIEKANLTLSVPESRTDMLIEEIQACYNDREIFQKKLNPIIMKKAAIYGMGAVGKSFFWLLKKYDVEITAIIDRVSLVYGDMSSVGIEEYEHVKDSYIIVSIRGDKDEILNALLKKGICGSQIIWADSLL